MSESDSKSVGKHTADHLTREQAIQFADAKVWEEMTMRERAEFQLHQQFLCMPFANFHEAVTHSLGRDVWTHEFVDRERLLNEFYGHRPRPSMLEIIDLIPAEKRLVIGIAKAEGR